MKKISLRFVRWGTGLLVLGVWTGYGPLHHYIHGGVEVACPWAPVHGHVVLLGWVGLTLFGLVYRALPEWGAVSPRAVKLAAAHLWVSIVAILGVFVNGTFGYRYLDSIAPSFYYEPKVETLQLWLSIDGAFLTLYALGCFLFLWIVFAGVKYETEGSFEDSNERAKT